MADSPEIRKRLVVESYLQYDDSRFMAQRAAGGIQSNLCFAPPDLDLLRYKMRKYWNTNGIFGERSNNPHIEFQKIEEKPWTRTTEKKELLTVEQDRNLSWGLGTPQEWAWEIDFTQPLEPNIPTFDGIFRGEPLASVFGSQNGVRGKIYHDHAFEMQVPFTKKEIDNGNFGLTIPPYADFKSVYNFYVNSYEGIIDDSGVDERVIPNMYAFLLVLQESDPEDVIIAGDNSTIDDIFERHVTLQNTIKDTLFASDANGSALTKEVVNKTSKDQIRKSSKNQYFDKYAKNYSAFKKLMTTNPQAQEVRNKFTNIVAPLTDIELYRDFNNKKKSFPMGMDISFSTDRRTEFAEILKDSKLSSTLIKDVIQELPNFKELSKRLEEAGTNPERRVPYSSGLVVWAGPKNEQFFTRGFVMYVDQNSVFRPLSNVRISTNPSYFVGDKVLITDWNHVYLSPDQNSLSILATPDAAGVGRENYYTDIEFSSGVEKWSRGNPGTQPFVESAIERDGWEINIIAYWKDWREPTPIGGVRGRAKDWDGPDFVAGTFSAGTAKAGRYNRWQAYSQQQREFADAVGVPLTIVDLPAKTRIDESFKQWDITNWITSLATDPGTTYQPGGSEMVFLGQYNEEIETASQQGSISPFYKRLMTLILAGRVSQLMEEKTRSFEQILNGEKAYSETVFYKIEKWSVNRNGDFINNLQSIYLPNSNSIDVHQYIDTQVKYGKRYGYKVFAFQAVFGTRYRYVLNDLAGVAGSTLRNVLPRTAEICVFTKPSVRLIKVPYYEFVGMVMDDPPVWPDVDILQYRNHNDEVLFFFRGNVGNYKMKPIAIDADDQFDIDMLREAHNVSELEPITFKSDDQARVFEIFRLNSKPSSYQQFEGYKRQEVETDVYEDPNKAATAAAFVDIIQPNKKYYYMFRTVDVHRHTSNPTAIYEVEMVDHDGAATLVTRVLPIKREKDPRQAPTKNGKKYIHIVPSATQFGINKERTGLLDDNGVNKLSVPLEVKNNGVQLGMSGEVVWGKKYKIRVRSKQTGKAIDFNLEFKSEAWRDTDQGIPNG